MNVFRTFPLLVAAYLLACTELLVAETYYSAAMTGNWNTPATWRTSSFSGPVATMPPNMATDNIVIGSGHTISLNTDAVITNLTILDGTLQYDNVALRRLEVQGNMRIEANGYLTIRQTGMRRENELFLRGNVVVNGRWEMRPDMSSNNYIARVIFASPLTQTISGTTTNQALLFRVSLNKGGKSSIVDCSIPLDISTGTDAAMDAFYFNDTFYNSYGSIGGTWRQSANTLSLHQSTVGSRNQFVEVTGAIHIIGSANMLFGNVGNGATFTLQGGELLFNTASAQPSLIGRNAGNSLVYVGNADISNFTLRQGTVVIAGRFSRTATTSTAAVSFEQSGGTIVLGAVSNTSIVSLLDIPVIGSTFRMSAGTIIFRNAGSATRWDRSADLFLGTPVNSTISGGTIQFGDAQSAPMQQFNINIPQNLALANLTLFNGASLNPYAPAQNLRVAGNILVNGTFDGTQTHTGTTATTAVSTLTLQGNNAVNQLVWGVGTLRLHHCTMNRQSSGAGVAQLFRTATVQGVLNLQEIPSAVPQILELGPSTDLILTNPNTNAIQNAVPFSTPDTPELRAVRTSSTSGRLFRAVMAAGTADYLFPVSSLGSAVRPQASYNPLRYEATSVSGGQLGVRLAVGGSTAPTTQGAHRQVQSGVTSFARRYWSLQASGLTGTGRIIAAAPSDFAGSPDATRFSRYRPDETTPNGTWFLGDTLTFRAASELEGDWTWLESPQRIFYSRASGNWTDAASWSFVSHRGAQVANGIFPSRATDSVVVGGGASGKDNHVIALTREVSIGGIQVGVGINTTGTLECTDDAVLGGNIFRLNDRSTLRIGSAQGIMLLPNNIGNIRTSAVRSFSPNAVYEYIGATAQVFGDALPSTVYALGMAKPVGITLAANRSISITQNLSLTSGTLELGIFTLKNTTPLPVLPSNMPPPSASELSLCSMGAGAILRIGGTGGFADASTGTVSNYAVYRLDERSTVEWHGTQHVIEPIPQNVALTALGGDANANINANFNVYGNISLRNEALVSAWNPVFLRGSLWIRDAVRFVNYSPQFRILGSAYNNASFLNLGVMDIGQ